MAVPATARAAVADAAAGIWRRTWSDWLAGLRLIMREQWLTVLFVAVAVNQFAEGVLNVAYLMWVKEMLGGGAQEVGWLLSAQAVGSIVGAPIIAWVAMRVPPKTLIGAAGVSLGAYWGLMLVWRDLTAALVLMAAVGVPIIGFGVAMSSLMQTGVPDEFRGRVWGAFMTTMAITGLLGRAFVSLLGDGMGAAPLIAIVALFDALAGLIAWTFLSSPRLAPTKLATEGA